MLFGVNPLRTEVYSQASRLKVCAIGSASNTISRFQQNHLSTGIHQIAGGTQASETSTNHYRIDLLHDAMLHARSQS